MRLKRYTIVLFSIVCIIFLIAAGWYLHHTNIPVLEPRGQIAAREKDLIVFALALSLLVVIPVFGLLFFFAWHYREGNTKAKYSPKLSGNRKAETVWWLIPSALIIVLSVVTWRASHTLDPYRPIASKTPALTVQVVALDWKWLFIYPAQGIASVNFLKIPNNTPINFEITSDAPMNSFWIPQLGGQIYAMPGMSTQLHLIANQDGNYYGSSANISGEGFAGMNFVTQASSTTDFDAWVRSLQRAPDTLNQSAYTALAQPSENNGVRYYSSPVSNLYDTIVLKYMVPAGQSLTSMSQMEM